MFPTKPIMQIKMEIIAFVRNIPDILSSLTMISV